MDSDDLGCGYSGKGRYASCPEMNTSGTPVARGCRLPLIIIAAELKNTADGRRFFPEQRKRDGLEDEEVQLTMRLMKSL